MLSIILPSNNEPETRFLEETRKNLKSLKGCELIVVGLEEAPTRAERLNIGYGRAKGSMLLFHHPRSLIDFDGVNYLIANSGVKMWGGFTHQFDHDHAVLRFTSWYSNRVRARWQKILYLDHCIFFHRSLWAGEMPAMEIFEDTVLSRRLGRTMSPRLLPYASTTSAIRFRENGVYKQSLLNQLLKIAFALHLPQSKMNKLYERGLGLNAKRSRGTTL